ncbi:radical SAM protein [Flavisolibacter ginsenosidimutans]|uniref:Radical SAM protein n=1 Tax=Flavisolibacter ginsenosidimutans TaxID=661481 RepID=A0A5B8UL04_9BACT|nr:radical SAM protein [Flavisolibacter ginsenosidimutans]QEC57347.1 radical SAM protein [Flavisolibacter ginsenosidimutans]
METTLRYKRINLQPAASDFINDCSAKTGRVSFLKRTFLWWAVKLRIFYFACCVLKKPSLILRTFNDMLRLRNNVWGGDLKKMYKVDGKYYFNLYTPGWPSKAYDDLIKTELRRHASPLTTKETLSFIHLAITRKCPLRCEHCFEWDNLNQKESFTKEDLFRVIDLYKNEGVLQIHFSGGEPMVRLKDLVELVRYASPHVACWVLTSGFNFTPHNARLLREAGCKGVVVSLDHYLPYLHNAFRGKENAFNNALTAVAAAKNVGLVTALSVCATKTFLHENCLLPYMDFAKSLGVQFVQVLEPRNIGHYADKDVLLDEAHIALLEETFTLVNHAAKYRHHPTMLYHGYHQRRVGCFSGSRSVYIDSAGDVHACPFCHTKSYNILSIVRANEKALPQKENSCPRFGKIA